MSLRLVLSFVIFLLVSENECIRLKDEMYESFPASRACYRRLNGTHQIGCSSDYGGSVGIVTFLRNDTDLNWLLHESKASPYAVVMEISMLKHSIIDKLTVHSDKVAGLIIYQHAQNRPSFFSHESRCPNEFSQGGPDNTYCKSGNLDDDVWNPVGTEFMLHDVPFPVFYIPPDKYEYVTSILECYDKFNSFELDQQTERSLCSIEMDAFMYAAVNSEVCIRRSNMMVNLRPTRYCDPLADKSLYFSLFTRNNFTYKTSDFHNINNDTEELEVNAGTETDGNVALISVAMDSTSFIDGFGVGAVGTVSSMSVLMATAHALSQMFPKEGINPYNKNIIFMIFNGESYDYIGSQRFAWDLIHGYFPMEGPILKPTSIGLHIHIGQLHGKSSKLKLFTPDYEDLQRNEKIDEFARNLALSQDSVIRGKKIPPSSVHTFLRLFNSSVTQMASAVLADHGESFDNAYYQSLLDDKDNLNFKYYNLSSNIIIDDSVPGGNPIYPDGQIPKESIQFKLANISTTLAISLYKFVTGHEYRGNISASSFIIDEILHCYLESASCELLSVTRKHGSAAMPPDVSPPSLYIGVSGYYSPASKITSRLSSFLMSTPINRTKENCHAKDDETILYQYITGWDEKGVCIRSFMNDTFAMSPAFIEEGYDFASGKYSTWTESVWQSISLRMLVQPPSKRKNMTLGLGIMTFVLSTAIIIGIRKHVINLLYEDAESVSRVDC